MPNPLSNLDASSAADLEAGATVKAVVPGLSARAWADEERRLRWEILRKVYAVLVLQFYLAAGTVAVGCYVRPVRRFLSPDDEPPHSRAATAFLLAAPGLIMIWPMLQCKKKHPANLLLLGFITVSVSLAFSVAGPKVFLQAMVLTVAACVSLFVYTFCAPLWRCDSVDFLLPWVGYLTCLLTMGLVVVAQVFLRMCGGVETTGLGLIAAMLFSAFVLYDTEWLICHDSMRRARRRCHLAGMSDTAGSTEKGISASMLFLFDSR